MPFESNTRNENIQLLSEIVRLKVLVVLVQFKDLVETREMVGCFQGI